MEINENFDLSKVLYYRIGPIAKLLLKIESQDDLFEALSYIKEKKISKFLVIGLGSNLLINDKFFDGCAIWFSKPVKPVFETKDGLVKTFSSNLLDDLIQFSFTNNLIGLGWAGGLPSTVGGAARGNAGCFGHEIKDIFEKAEVIDFSSEKLTVKELLYEEMGFSYRHSVLKENKNLILVNAFFNLRKGSAIEVENDKKEYLQNIGYRKNYHPLEYPSCGSVFQNIVDKNQVEKIISKWPDLKSLSEEKWHHKISIGFLITRLGFTGFQVGGAQVSEKHANYIVNKDRATFSDVLSIINQIKEKFFQTFGFYPQTEVEIVN